MPIVDLEHHDTSCRDCSRDPGCRKRTLRQEFVLREPMGLYQERVRLALDEVRRQQEASDPLAPGVVSP